MRFYFGLAQTCALLFSLSTFIATAQTTQCGITVNAGPDQVFCTPGQTLTLSGAVTGDFLSAAWTPTAGIANPNSLNTTLTANAAGNYTLTARTVNGPNLVTNGDFSQGNTGFTTQYTLGANGQFGPLTNTGTYGITNVANLLHSQFAPCTDHTGGGQMLVVNGATSPRNMWCQTVTVTPNTDYAFSAWFAVVATQNPSLMRFTINGNTIGNNFTLPNMTCEWTRFFRLWNSGAATTAQICIANVSTSAAGNDFCLDDISLRTVCDVADVIAIAPANLNAGFQTNPVCENSSAFNLNTLLSTGSTAGGQWTIGGVPATTFQPAVLGAGTYTLNYRVQQGTCSRDSTRSITIHPLPDAGTAAQPAQVCRGAVQTLVLSQLLSGADAGGSWTEAPPLPSPPGAFIAAAGSLQTQNLAAGQYNFRYIVAGTAPCPNDTTTVSVVIVAPPTAQAGPDQSLDCIMRQVSIGSAASSSGPGIVYSWTSPNGGMVAQPASAVSDTDAGGTYVLAVTDNNTGCSARDTVIVTNLITEPDFSLDIQPVTCHGDNDGSISVGNVSGATAPTMFQLDGGLPQMDGTFNNLSSGDYTLRLTDANGCFAERQAMLPEPPPIMLEIGSDLAGTPPVLQLGESATLRILTNLAPDQIQSTVWLPLIPDCDNCPMPVVRPVEKTTYFVVLTDANNCIDTASITIFIDRTRRIFVPNAFSPNDDGINDRLAILSGPEVQQILSFRIADRWGSIVFEQKNTQTNDPDFGWDGRIKGKEASQGVYVYVAELELIDGTSIVVSGETVLVK
jgi:gliding motility-associated-like protein